MVDAYEQEVARADRALRRDDFERPFTRRERAPVLVQRMAGRHTAVHWRMLMSGLRRGDFREAVGQAPRIVVSILFSRLWVPRRNSGRARISACKSMPASADLRHLVP